MNQKLRQLKDIFLKKSKFFQYAINKKSPNLNEFSYKQNIMNRPPLYGLCLLWILACILAFSSLGDVPLRDFDEGTVARVALELSNKKGFAGFFPTIWGGDYLNKPPGLHWIIASIIQFNRNVVGNHSLLPSEFVIRFAPAFLSSLVVPIGGLLQWNLRPNDRTSSLATASILLTLLPIARHGRLAMLDGTQLTAIALFWLFLLSLNKTRMDRWRALGAGLTGSFMLLLKAPLLIPVLFAACIAMIWSGELKKFLHFQSLYFLIVGFIPGVSWHCLNIIERGEGAFWLWWGDGAGRVLFEAGSGSDLGWRVPLIEILEGGWPWLLLWPIAIGWAWRDRQSLWGIWTLSTQIVLAMAIFPLKTQLPWYSHPLWLPMALLCAPPLAWLVRRDKSRSSFGKAFLRLIPWIWMSLGMVFIVFGLIGFLHLIDSIRSYSSIALFVGIGWVFGSVWLLSSVKERRIQGLLGIVGGNFVGLILLMNQPFWLWELNEHWSVERVASLITNARVEEVAIDALFERPSLNWYARQRIPTIDENPTANWIVTSDFDDFVNSFPKRNCKVHISDKEWNLLSCNP